MTGRDGSTVISSAAVNRLLPIAFSAGGLLVLAAAAAAQVNTESLRPGVEESGWSGSFDLQLEIREGNTERLGAGGRFRLQHTVHEKGGTDLPEDAVEPVIEEGSLDPAADTGGGTGGSGPLTLPRRVLFWVADANRAEQSGQRSENRAFSHLRAVRRVAPRVQVEGFLQYEFNQFTRLDSRYLAGAGGRFALAARQDRAVFLGSGLMFETERLDVAPGSPEKRRIEAVRSTSYLSVKLDFPGRHLLLAGTLYVQPRVDRPEDLRLLQDTTLQVALGQHLSLGLELTLRYDREPPIGVDELDVALTHFLRYRF